MTDQAKAARRAYDRAWAAKNRDKRKAANERYWENRVRRALEEQAAQPVSSNREEEQT